MGSSSKARNSIRTAVSQNSGTKRSQRKWLPRVIATVACIVLLVLLSSWWGGGFTEPQAVAEIHSMVDDIFFIGGLFFFRQSLLLVLFTEYCFEFEKNPVSCY